MKIQIPEESIRTIGLLLDFGDPCIIRINELIEQAGPSLASPDNRALQLADELRGSVSVEDLASVLKEVVYPSHDLRYRFDLSAGEVYAAMTEAIKDAPAEARPADLLERWARSRTALLGLLGNTCLQKEAKARILLETRPNRVRHLSVFTDLRPVFDKPGNNIYFNIITHSLCVRFQGDRGLSTLYFSLDAEDLDELEQQIKRARSKEDAVDDLYQSKDVPVLKVRSDERDYPTNEGASE